VGILLASNNNINTMDSASFTGEVFGGYRTHCHIDVCQ
jgi:hypothetical protein